MQETATGSGEDAELPPPARPKGSAPGGSVAATPPQAPEDDEDGFHVPSAEMIRYPPSLASSLIPLTDLADTVTVASI